MLRKWSEITADDGSAASATAQLAANLPVIDGAVVPASAMPRVLSEREEQINALVDVVDNENIERVAEELKRTIITIHVPKDIQKDIDQALDAVTKPVLMRLSPSGTVADPLAPTMIIGIADEKLALDAARMLYAELYSAENLAATEERKGAIIIQRMPHLTATYRIIRHGAHIIVEGTRGFGAWVGYGEPDHFLFENDAFVRAEHGDGKGVAWDDDAPKEFLRTPLGGEDAEKLLAFAKPYLDAAPMNSPLLFCATENGFLCLGAGPAIVPKNE